MKGPPRPRDDGACVGVRRQWGAAEKVGVGASPLAWSWAVRDARDGALARAAALPALEFVAACRAPRLEGRARACPPTVLSHALKWCALQVCAAENA